MKKFLKLLILMAILAGAASLAEFFVFQKNIKQPVPQTANNISASPENEPIPAPNTANSETQFETGSDPSTAAAAIPDSAPAPTSPDHLPAKFLLQIPFYSQAPLGAWDAVHEEMCEESSVLNAALYLENKKLTKEEFESELQKIKEVEQKEIGEWKSTTISQVKRLVDIYFEGRIKTRIIENPTIADIETEIATGNPVVVPLAGREIGNPNFTPPGPVYHMLVIKGYDGQNFITNDVGTRKGDSYIYKKDVITENMHDWNAQDIHFGVKRVLVLLKNS